MIGLAAGSRARSRIVPREVGWRLQALTVIAGKRCKGSPNLSSDSAGRQDDLAACTRLEELAVLPELHADGALAVEQHSFDQDTGFKPQVGPSENRLEESAGRGPANAALLVDVEVTDPAVVPGVEVRCRRNAHFNR